MRQHDKGLKTGDLSLGKMHGTKVTAGKFEGKSFKYVYEREYSYVTWLYEQPARRMIRFYELIKYACARDKIELY